jgi:protein-L-isoaspartate(D-aspartate) O-methyltransferase
MSFAWNCPSFIFCPLVPNRSFAGETSVKVQTAAKTKPEGDVFGKARSKMVEDDICGKGIRDQSVINAISRIKRECFIPADHQALAYSDAALQIGYEQTISRPYIVALMTELVKPSPEKRALDIGTGSGYQAAMLGETCKEVYSIEILKPLADEACNRLATMGYKNIHVRCGDGYKGWPEKAPFDVIVVAAAPDHVPQPLIDQLAPGGRLIIPVGDCEQVLLLLEKNSDGSIKRREISPVKFVSMTGEAKKKYKVNQYEKTGKSDH